MGRQPVISAPGELSRAIATILQARMAEREVSQNRTAKAAGMSQGQLSDVLNGKKQLNVEQLDALCLALGLRSKDVWAKADKATLDRVITSPAKPL